MLASRGSRAPASGAHYTPLPATGTEANAAADSFSRAYHGRADVLVGSHATKEALSRLLPGHRYLHLATHGYFAPPSVKSAASPDPTSLASESAGRLGRSDIEGFFPGLLSGLAWAGANKPPIDPATGLVDIGAGTMTAEEVGSLDLSGCELAVLSACETGLGRSAGGEGVLGLQRAFHQAGCRTVIASLWKVDDAATAALMTRFYEHLWGEKLSPIESFQGSARDARRPYAVGSAARASGHRRPTPGRGRGKGSPEILGRLDNQRDTVCGRPRRGSDRKVTRLSRSKHRSFLASLSSSRNRQVSIICCTSTDDDALACERPRLKKHEETVTHWMAQAGLSAGRFAKVVWFRTHAFCQTLVNETQDGSLGPRPCVNATDSDSAENLGLSWSVTRGFSGLEECRVVKVRDRESMTKIDITSMKGTSHEANTRIGTLGRTAWKAGLLFQVG